MGQRICSNCGSDKGGLKRGLCSRCYQRWRRHGDPNVVRPGGPAPGDLAERFWSKVDRRSAEECWPWTGWINPYGYGVFRLPDKNVMAHRFAYELLVGPLAPDLTIDHLCHEPPTCHLGVACPHRRCVNPAHLEAVPMTVNVMRGSGVGATNAAKTHCKRGHEFTPENTRLDSQGKRICRQCVRAADRAYKQRKRKELM